MKLCDKFGYLSVGQIRASVYDGQVAYLPKQQDAGGLAVLTVDDVAAWAPLATASPPCFLVVNYEDNQASWMGGGWAVGVAKATWIAAQLDALNIANVPCVYLSADYHPGADLPAVLDCLRGAQSVLGARARAVYGFVETLDAARAAGLADYFWLCGSRDGLAGRPWINLYQHNNDQDIVDGVTVDVDDVLTPSFGQWDPAAVGAPAPTATTEEITVRLIQSTDRGIAVVGAGYFRQLYNDTEVKHATLDVGAGGMGLTPNVMTTEQFDLTVMMSTGGRGTDDAEWVFHRTAGFEAQRYYIPDPAKPGSVLVVTGDHPGALPCTALDTADGNYLSQRIAGLAAAVAGLQPTPLTAEQTTAAAAAGATAALAVLAKRLAP